MTPWSDAAAPLWVALLAMLSAALAWAAPEFPTVATTETDAHDALDVVITSSLWI